MTKRVVFVGGVQVKALAKAYRLDVALDRDDDVYFISASSIQRESAQRIVTAADILVTDLTLVGPTVPDRMVSVGTLRILVPVVSGDFLWPYSGRAHPRNAPFAGLPDGPYPADFGDSYLDSLAANGVAEDVAVRRYLNLDIARDANLDEKLRTSLTIQERLDKESGFAIAPFIAANFRKQTLFATRERMAMPLFRHVASRLFGQMGILSDSISSLSETFFPPGFMPLHPGVLKHFGMAEPKPDHLYPILDEGFFSFEQYCRRYFRFEWNKLLHAAIAMVDSNPSEAIPALKLALETSPLSNTGQRALKDAERAVRDETMLPILAITDLPASVNRAVPPGRPVPAVSDDPAQAPVAFPSPIPPPPAAAANDQDEPAVTPATLRRPSVPPKSFVGGPIPAPLPEQDADLPRVAFQKLPDEPAESDRILMPTFQDVKWPAPELTQFETQQTDILRPSAPMGADAPAALTPGAGTVPRDYVELPMTPFGDFEPAGPVGLPAKKNERFAPLPPAEHLIKVLPMMLPNARSMASVADIPFAAMPETQPPPPLRPVLPPELNAEAPKEGFFAKISEAFKK